MNVKSIILLFILPVFMFVVSENSFGQAFNYVQYTTRDGLPGNTVYEMCQDLDGYLWFGTDNGLSRYDGVKFVNFTVKDGLPDNEVLRVFADGYGRVWLGTFRNEISYYYKGKIYNQRNDSLLATIRLNSRVNDFVEFPQGTIWLQGTDDVFKIKTGELPERILPNKDHPGKYNVGLGFGPFWFGENLPIVIDDSLFYYKNGELVFYSRFGIQKRVNRIYSTRVKPGDTPYVHSKNDVIHAYEFSKMAYLICTVDGAYDVDSVNLKLGTHYLAGKTITSGLIDKEGLYWFTSLGDGVFKLPTKEALTLRKFTPPNSANEVFSFSFSGNELLTGSRSSSMNIWADGKLLQTLNFEKYLANSLNQLSTNRLNAMLKMGDGSFILGFDAFLVKWKKGNEMVMPAMSVKSLFKESEDTVLVTSGRMVYRVQVPAFKPIDTIWQQRATSAIKFGSSYFIGTLEGLIEVQPGGKLKNWGMLHPSLHRRISSLILHENSIWAATGDSGVVEIRNGRVSRTFSEKDGLSSNIVKTLFAFKNAVWVGTTKGLSKIMIDTDRFITGKFNSLNVLPSDIINAIYTDGKKIYVGSPAGLTYFEEEKFYEKSFCNLDIHSIYTEKGFYPLDTLVELNYSSNRFEISYSGISMKSAGDITYFFRMKGLDETWQQTLNTEITFSALPIGNYEFQLYAVNRFGAKSNTLRVKVDVPAPFWKKSWFYFWLFFISGIFIWQGAGYRTKLVNRNLEEKSRIQKQLADLELKALQAQMNPHFIFNCLNSIQQYILSNDAASANHFLSIFAMLIRETLENSVARRTTVRREIDYLKRYLDLEKMRFGNKFNYEIKVLLKDTEVELPVMLLQPFVENAIRHGIRNRQDNLGFLVLSFDGDSNTLICKIMDNGVGRMAAGEFKSSEHIEYQSRGMEITGRRMNILNQTGEESVDIKINDLVNEAGEPLGTEVIIAITKNNNDAEFN